MAQFDRQLTVEEAMTLRDTEFYDNPALMSDFYKQCHAEQYNKKMTKMVSYFTPRMDRFAESPDYYGIKNSETLTLFGLQRFVRKTLVNYFNKNFFNMPEEMVVEDYRYTIENTLTAEYCESEKILALHRLGYLPIKIRAVKEGTRVPVKVPMVEVSNTHPKFSWCTNFIESVFSSNGWYPCEIANVFYNYRETANKYYALSVDDNISARTAVSEFGFRGSKMDEAGIVASMAALLSFTKTATIPAIRQMEYYYNCKLDRDNVGQGMISTEHSVHCSNTAIDGNEVDFVRRLLTEKYTTGNISMVSDSYDYWNMVQNIICGELKEEVAARKGTLFVRGDSGNPADIICGTFKEVVDRVPGLKFEDIESYYRNIAEKENKINVEYHYFYTRVNERIYYVQCNHVWEEDSESCDGGYHSSEIGSVTVEEFHMTTEMKGTIEILAENFGYKVNTKGYMVLPDYIRGIYGDSITNLLQTAIYQRLMDRGFAVNNVALGAGSFSMQCAMAENKRGGRPLLLPFTRDTHGMAIKATYAELTEDDGTIIPVKIFKDPKTDTGNFKKSQMGLCRVYRQDDGTITYEDNYDSLTIPGDDIYVTYFEDGLQTRYESIMEIRDRLWEGKF